MEKVHCEAIKRNFKILVHSCDISLLIPELIKRGIITKSIVDAKYRGPDQLTNKRNLFFDIQRKGANAFYELVDSLREIGQENLARNLCICNENNSCGVYIPDFIKPHGAVPFQLPCTSSELAEEIQNLSYQSSVENNRLEFLDIKVRYSTKFHQGHRQIPTYKTNSKHRGYVLIINNIHFDHDSDREGADKDARCLIELFQQFGLIVEYHEDKKAEEIKHVVREFTAKRELQISDMAVMIALSHGDQTSEQMCYLKGTDNKEVKTSFIEEQFNNVNCPFLKDKPKILIYQICRGKNNDYVEKDRGHHDILPNFAPPSSIDRTYSDMLIAHSTLPGYLSHRDAEKGSWFIQKLCQVFMKHAYNTTVDELFKIVDDQLKSLQSDMGTMQTSTYQSIGFNTCFFNPGIYLDDDGVIKQLPRTTF